MHQIHEEDLAELERLMPIFCDRMSLTMDNRLRRQLRKCKDILSNVRWGYGPPSHVEIVPNDKIGEGE